MAAFLLALPQTVPAQNQHQHTVPLFVSDYNAPGICSLNQTGDRSGRLRVFNRSNRDGTVKIRAYDDNGRVHGPVDLFLNAKQTVQFSGAHLEEGGPDYLSDGIGYGTGDWRLELTTDLHIETLALVRTCDGFLAPTHDVVAHSYGRYHVPFFHPAGLSRQVSLLRLVNPNDAEVNLVIEGMDQSGRPGPAGTVGLALPANAARIYSASDLENGHNDLDGRLGDGTGKWELFVVSARPVHVLSLSQSSGGHWANLSSAAPDVAAGNFFDSDGDGLIEIYFLEQLAAVRYDLDGDGKPDRRADMDEYEKAFPYAPHPDKGGRYRGYELARSLDFGDRGSYESGERKEDWLRGRGWEPIGKRVQGGFRAVFDGNRYTIRGLYINLPEETDNNVGLFEKLGGSQTATEKALLINVGLVDVDIRGYDHVGGLAGEAAEGSYILASYVENGSVKGNNNVGGLVGKAVVEISDSYSGAVVEGNRNVGGFVGFLYDTGKCCSSIARSYADVEVIGSERVGGLVGGAVGKWRVHDSYVRGEVSGEDRSSRPIGGLIGYGEGRSAVKTPIYNSYVAATLGGDTENGGLVGESGDYGYAIEKSYWNTDLTAFSVPVGGSEPPAQGGQGKSTAELKKPTNRSPGIYVDWNRDIDNDGIGDVWDFGTGGQYPALLADFDGDGTATWEEFGEQRRD